MVNLYTLPTSVIVLFIVVILSLFLANSVLCQQRSLLFPHATGPVPPARPQMFGREQPAPAYGGGGYFV